MNMQGFQRICRLVACVGTAAVLNFGASAQIADITWEIGPNIPDFRKGGCGTALGGKVQYIFGMSQPWEETKTLLEYDPGKGWWTKEAEGPLGQTYVHGTEHGGAFYAIGGRNAGLGGVHTRSFKLEAAGSDYSWTRMPDLNEARGWAPSVAVGSKLYVFGGAKGGHGPTLDSVEVFDTADPDAGWEVVARIPNASRGWTGAAAVDGSVYLIGGSHFFEPEPESGPDRERFAEVWAFNPETHEWMPKAPLPFPLSGMDCAVYEDRYIIVAGGAPSTEEFSPELKERYEGTDRYESYYSPFLLVYDTANDSWEVLPSVMPVPANDIRVALDGNKLYALGGENIEPATSNTTCWLRIGTIVDE